MASGCRQLARRAAAQNFATRASLIMLVLAYVFAGIALCSYLLYATARLERKRWRAAEPSCWPARSW